MSNYTAIRQLITQFSGQENIFTIPRMFVHFTGDLNTAALLNQIIFYSDKSKCNKQGYFYKSYKEWEQELGLSEYQVRRSTKQLKEIGIVDTRLFKANGSPTVHYKLNYEELSESILKFLKIPNQSNSRIQPKETKESLTEITTENTTKNIYSNEFEQFWNVYPKKMDKKKAYKSFKSCIKKHPINTILTGTKKYAQSVQKTEKKFIKHASTFLNNESYIDGFEESEEKKSLPQYEEVQEFMF